MSIALNTPTIETSLAIPAPLQVPAHQPNGTIRQRRVKGNKAAPSVVTKANADLVLRAFNTWAYKRQQPDHIEILQKNIATAIEEGKPLEFCLYWGKGPRHHISHAEIECLDYLNSLRQRIRDIYAPGADFMLIFTDTHALLNGHKRDVIDSYVDEVRSAAEARGFTSCFLSHIVQRAADAGCQPAAVPLHLLDKLSITAAKWYRGEGSVELGALRYLEMNMIEKRAVEHAFPRSTFVTFNGGEMRDLFPDAMPIFYMYSVRRGVAVKPWFIEEINAVDAAVAALPERKAVCGGAL